MNKEMTYHTFVNGRFLGNYSMLKCCKIAGGMKNVTEFSFLGNCCCFIAGKEN